MQSTKLEHFPEIFEKFSLEYYERNPVCQYKIKKYYFFAKSPYASLDSTHFGLYYVHNTRTRLCYPYPVMYYEHVETIEDAIKLIRKRTFRENTFTAESFDKFPFEL